VNTTAENFQTPSIERTRRTGQKTRPIQSDSRGGLVLRRAGEAQEAFLGRQASMKVGHRGCW
jgi:hypothetical protein